MRSARYCPVCGKIWDKSLDYCPECKPVGWKAKRKIPGIKQFKTDYDKGVLLVRIWDYGEGF